MRVEVYGRRLGKEYFVFKSLYIELILRSAINFTNKL